MSDPRKTTGNTVSSTVRRLPAEWEPQEAVWLAWPHNRDDWPGALAEVERVYADMVRMLSAQGNVRLVVSGEAEQGRVVSMLVRAGADMPNVAFLRAPTDRSWVRDTLPFFVQQVGMGDGGEGMRAVRFSFNGWARYADHQLDARLAATVARDLDMPVDTVFHAGRPVVLEGGAVDANGQGDLLATEECLLDSDTQCRNPGMDAGHYERLFGQHLGIANVIWLGRGIQGDDTHGHVDDFCRFVNPATVVLCREDNPADPNHFALEENRERLESARLIGGGSPHIVRLPMPAPRYLDDLRLPASYANFLITNHAVLVPTFGDPMDSQTLGILSELMPGRAVQGVDARHLILGLGGVHCLTREQPGEKKSGT